MLWGAWGDPGAPHSEADAAPKCWGTPHADESGRQAGKATGPEGPVLSMLLLLVVLVGCWGYPGVLRREAEAVRSKLGPAASYSACCIAG